MVADVAALANFCIGGDGAHIADNGGSRQAGSLAAVGDLLTDLGIRNGNKVIGFGIHLEQVIQTAQDFMTLHSFRRIIVDVAKEIPCRLLVVYPADMCEHFSAESAGTDDYQIFHSMISHLNIIIFRANIALFRASRRRKSSPVNYTP